MISRLWAIMIGMLLFVPIISFAEPVTFVQTPPVPMKPGLHIEYEAWNVVHPLRPAVREDYAITLLDVWPGGVVFRYRLDPNTMGGETGIQSLSSLDECTSLDPWWEPMKTDFDDRCELWIPRHALLELLTDQKTWFAVDAYVRGDSMLRWEKQNDVRYLCTLNDHPALLNAIRVITTRGDEFVILNDPNNPLILSAKSTYFSWRVSKISMELGRI